MPPPLGHRRRHRHRRRLARRLQRRRGNRARLRDARPRGAHRCPGDRPGGHGARRRSWRSATNTDAGAWDQVPVQVDQRHVELLTKLRNGTGTTGAKVLAYSDPAANAGADPVPTFDADDEVAFMVDDTGGRAAPEPATRRGSSRAAASRDGTRPAGRHLAEARQRRRLVYLFERSARRSFGAGADYVGYDFAPVDPMGHAEDSTVSDRPLHHPLRRPLDPRRDHPRRRAPTSSTGTATSSRSGTAVAARTPSRPATVATRRNVDGPVRVIRSYLGANSGTYTQREHVFYRGRGASADVPPRAPDPGDHGLLRPQRGRRRHDATRARRRPGSPSTGRPTRSPSAAPTWEAVAGTQGTLVTVASLSTSIPGVTMQGYYNDDSHAARRSSARATPSSTAPPVPPSPAPSRTPTPPSRSGGVVHGDPVEHLRARRRVHSVPVQVDEPGQPAHDDGGALPLSDQPSVPTAVLRRLGSILTLGPMVGDSDIFRM